MSVQKLIAEADRFLEKGKYQEAADKLESALADDPMNQLIVTKLAGTYQELRQPAKAAKVLTMLGNRLSEAGKAQVAIAVYKQALDLAPEDIDLKLRFAAECESVGKIGDAQAQAQLVLQHYVRRKKYFDASNIMPMLVRLNQRDERLKHAWVEIMQLSQAEKKLIHLVVAFSGPPGLQSQEFQVGGEPTNLSPALYEGLKTLVEFFPRDPKVAYAAAWTAYRRGRKKEFFHYLRECLRREPDFCLAMLLFARYLAESQKLNEAYFVFKFLKERLAMDRSADDMLTLSRLLESFVEKNGWITFMDGTDEALQPRQFLAAIKNEEAAASAEAAPSAPNTPEEAPATSNIFGVPPAPAAGGQSPKPESQNLGPIPQEIELTLGGGDTGTVVEHFGGQTIVVSSPASGDAPAPAPAPVTNPVSAPTPAPSASPQGMNPLAFASLPPGSEAKSSDFGADNEKTEMFSPMDILDASSQRPSSELVRTKAIEVVPTPAPPPPAAGTPASAEAAPPVAPSGPAIPPPVQAPSAPPVATPAAVPPVSPVATPTAAPEPPVAAPAVSAAAIPSPPQEAVVLPDSPPSTESLLEALAESGEATQLVPASVALAAIAAASNSATAPTPEDSSAPSLPAADPVAEEGLILRPAEALAIAAHEVHTNKQPQAVEPPAAAEPSADLSLSPSDVPDYSALETQGDKTMIAERPELSVPAKTITEVSSTSQVETREFQNAPVESWDALNVDSAPTEIYSPMDVLEAQENSRKKRGGDEDPRTIIAPLDGELAKMLPGAAARTALEAKSEDPPAPAPEPELPSISATQEESDGEPKVDMGDDLLDEPTRILVRPTTADNTNHLLKEIKHDLKEKAKEKDGLRPEHLLRKAERYLAKRNYYLARKSLRHARALGADEELVKEKLREIRKLEMPGSLYHTISSDVGEKVPSGQILERLEVEFDLTDKADEGEESEALRTLVEKRMDEIFRETDARTILDFGVGLHEMGLYRQAETLFGKIVSNFPEHAFDAYYLAAIAKHARKDYAGAASILKHLSLDPERPEGEKIQVYYALGEIFEKMSQPDRSKEFYRKVADLDANYRNVRNKLEE